MIDAVRIYARAIQNAPELLAHVRVFVAIALPCTTLGQDRGSARRDVGAYLALIDREPI